MLKLKVDRKEFEKLHTLANSRKSQITIKPSLLSAFLADHAAILSALAANKIPYSDFPDEDYRPPTQKPKTSPEASKSVKVKLKQGKIKNEKTLRIKKGKKNNKTPTHYKNKNL